MYPSIYGDPWNFQVWSTAPEVNSRIPLTSLCVVQRLVSPKPKTWKDWEKREFRISNGRSIYEHENFRIPWRNVVYSFLITCGPGFLIKWAIDSHTMHYAPPLYSTKTFQPRTNSRSFSIKEVNYCTHDVKSRKETLFCSQSNCFRVPYVESWGWWTGGISLFLVQKRNFCFQGARPSHCSVVNFSGVDHLFPNPKHPGNRHPTTRGYNERNLC